MSPRDFKLEILNSSNTSKIRCWRPEAKFSSAMQVNKCAIPLIQFPEDSEIFRRKHHILYEGNVGPRNCSQSIVHSSWSCRHNSEQRQFHRKTRISSSNSLVMLHRLIFKKRYHWLHRWWAQCTGDYPVLCMFSISTTIL